MIKNQILRCKDSILAREGLFLLFHKVSFSSLCVFFLDIIPFPVHVYVSAIVAICNTKTYGLHHKNPILLLAKPHIYDG